jgi:hypothetical protein
MEPKPKYFLSQEEQTKQADLSVVRRDATLFSLTASKLSERFHTPFLREQADLRELLSKGQITADVAEAQKEARRLNREDYLDHAVGGP